MALAAGETGAAAAAYASHKETHLNTAQAGEGQGVVLVPMVVEATCMWKKRASIVLQYIALAVAARSGKPQRLHSVLMQELCVLVRAYRARAALPAAVKRRRHEA